MEDNYKSPTKKLIKFFGKSRDQWKAKAIEAKTKIKLCNNRIKFLETSKASLKAEVEKLKLELKKARITNIQNDLDIKKKK
jgi:hypothetical protein